MENRGGCSNRDEVIWNILDSIAEVTLRSAVISKSLIIVTLLIVHWDRDMLFQHLWRVINFKMQRRDAVEKDGRPLSEDCFADYDEVYHDGYVLVEK